MARKSSASISGGFKLLFPLLVMVTIGQLQANPVNKNDKKEIRNLLNEITGYAGSSVCSTAQGQPGKCSFGYCSNLVNQTRVPCPGSVSTFYKCCPNQRLPEMFPPTVAGCGVRPVIPTGLIIGGKEAVPHSWPWAIALYRVSGYRKYFLCGGSIISDRFILTAAHCVSSRSESFEPEDFVVKIGAHKLNSGRFVEVERIMVHENYSPTYHNDDIALLKLKVPLNFGRQDSHISPVCLPKPEQQSTMKQDDDGQDGHRVEGLLTTMVGWGVNDQTTSTPSKTLQEVQVPVYNQKLCQQNYEDLIGSNTFFNWDNVICAGEEEGGKDTCQGDSGGSMTIESASESNQDTAIYEQIGIVSFGYGCAQKGYPGVYTFIPHYLNWLGYHMTL